MYGNVNTECLYSFVKPLSGSILSEIVTNTSQQPLGSYLGDGIIACGCILAPKRYTLVISPFSSIFTFLHLFLGVETSKVYNLGTTLLASTSPPPSSRCSIGSPCYTINGSAGRVDPLDGVDSIWAPKLGIKPWGF